MKSVLKVRQNPVLLALGANLESRAGSPGETIVSATDDLAAFGINVAARSRLYHTPCFPPGAGPDFVNAALLCHSERTPDQILAALGDIETRYGRQPAA
ncbi:MAG: 2-amino-4-hydroxy-6-hydroxymethyldihydropteridine diphosphokinase, partial [Paracoccaceae bacterium]